MIIEKKEITKRKKKRQDIKDKPRALIEEAFKVWTDHILPTKEKKGYKQTDQRTNQRADPSMDNPLKEMHGRIKKTSAGNVFPAMDK